MKRPTINLTKAKENPASQIGAYVLIALIATSLVAYFVITPLVRRANRDAKEASAYRDRIAALEELEDSTKTLRSKYELVAASRDNVLRMVPAGTDEAQLINILFKTAQINGVSLGSYSPESNTQITGGGALTATESQSSATGYAFSVSAVSTYEQMKKFIRDLENGPRLMQIQQVQFSSETAGISSSDTVSVLILITADYQNSELPAKLTEIKAKPAEDDSADATEDSEAENTNEATAE